MDYCIESHFRNLQGDLTLDIDRFYFSPWRRLSATHFNIAALIVDFLRANLVHAQRMLEPISCRQVELLHAYTIVLPLSTIDFDDFCAVPTFKHTPDLIGAWSEIHWLLKIGVSFVHYSLNTTPVNHMLYGLLGKTFHTERMHKNDFHLNRANDRERNIVVYIFWRREIDRYSKCMHHPDLRLVFGRRIVSQIGQFDARFRELPMLEPSIARQPSFQAIKI